MAKCLWGVQLTLEVMARLYAGNRRQRRWRHGCVGRWRAAGVDWVHRRAGVSAPDVDLRPSVGGVSNSPNKRWLASPPTIEGCGACATSALGAGEPVGLSEATGVQAVRWLTWTEGEVSVGCPTHPTGDGSPLGRRWKAAAVAPRVRRVLASRCG
jgi:hypothetical protein